MNWHEALSYARMQGVAACYYVVGWDQAASAAAGPPSPGPSPENVSAVIPRLLFFLSIPFFAGALYFTWCLRRFSASTLVYDRQFPRSWPYPDWLLIRLNDYLDKLNPAPPGTIKMHGEVEQVRELIGGAALALAAIGLALAFVEIRRRFVSARIRYRLSTFLITAAFGPPVLAWIIWRVATFAVVAYRALINSDA
jgi:hypothetical protein